MGGGPDDQARVLVRRGETVEYCVYAMHRRQDLYGTDADVFRPERWEEPALKGIGWGYLPFNGGPRICLGRELSFPPCNQADANIGHVAEQRSLPC